MTTLATPVNVAQSTIATGESYTRGTSTTIVLTDASVFPNSAQVIQISYGDHWCLVFYTSKATNTLTMGGGAADYALAKNVSVGDEAYEFPAGSYVEIVCAADHWAQTVRADGSVPLTADWDAGAFGIRALNLTADGLTSGRVIFAGADGLLSDSVDLTFGSNLLTVKKDAIAASQGDYGLALVNTTPALVGAQVQYSPPLRQRGTAWGVDGSVSNTVDFRQFVRPIAGNTVTGALDFQTSINGGAYSDLVTVLSNGNVGIGTTDPSVGFEYQSNTPTKTDDKMILQGGYLAGGGGQDYGFYQAYQLKHSGTGAIWTAARIKVVEGSEYGGQLIFETNPGPGNISATTTERMRILANGNVGIGLTAPLAKCHIDQASSAGAIPVLSLDQADLSDGFINFIGTSAASAVGPISTWTTGNSIQGFRRIEINGSQFWAPYYDAPTS